MKKLMLLEDDNNVIDTVDTKYLQISNLISSMIRTEWDAVDLYNSMLITLDDVNDEEAIETVNNILSDHYIHIGQLEKLLQNNNDNAIDIESGKELNEVE